MLKLERQQSTRSLNIRYYNTSGNKSEGFLRELGRNEMQGSYLYSRL